MYVVQCTNLFVQKTNILTSVIDFLIKKYGKLAESKATLFDFKVFLGRSEIAKIKRKTMLEHLKS